MMRKIRLPEFVFKPFSDKQIKTLTWWMPDTSSVADYDAIICEGSVRAGKTLALSLSFVFWAMETFNGENLAMAGKTISSLRRNVITPLKRMLKSRGYKVYEHIGANSMTVRFNGRTNEFYFFGGRDERSQADIQGITLAGMLFDEIALMPESFVNQATARCSVGGAKYWMNCNPEGPYHWFKLQWLDQAEQKRAFVMHWTMDDNLSLSERVKERLRNLYTGMFYQRFILGLWVAAQGAIYDMWDERENTFDDASMPPGLKNSSARYVGIDYGTQNATVFLDVYDDGSTLWVVDEYYYSGRAKGLQKEDSAYADDLDAFTAKGERPRFVIIDPSAASFKATLKHRGYRLKDADNEVVEGIRVVSTMIAKRRLKVHRNNCPNLLTERSAYVWDEKAANRGEEKPVKQADHALDALRYVVKTMISPRRLNH
jgi:PBSX family phage terminase large subunit